MELKKKHMATIQNERETHTVLQRAVQHAEQFLSELEKHPVMATATLEELRSRIGIELSMEGSPPEQVIDELVAATEGGILGSSSGRFFAWVIGGTLPAALAADRLTSTWDQNAAIYATSPAAAVVEEVAGEWLKDLLDLPRSTSFALTTGTQLAHFTGLAAARYAVLRDIGWDVNERGLFGAPPITVIMSEERHSSVDRAVRFLGIGTQHLVAVDTDAEGRITAKALASTLAQHPGPAIVVLDAADLNIAAFDGFAQLIPIAKSAGAWVHVDGAFGLLARASRTKRHYLEGVEAADSWATDGHKWLNAPFDCGIVFVRDRSAHRAAMTISASYLTVEKVARDQIDWNPEFSRRARGFALYAALRELGRSGVEDLIDRTCRHAAALVAAIGKLPTVEVLWQPDLNQGLVRFLDPRANATETDHNLQTDRVISAINHTGEAFFGGANWRGKRVMRVSVVNWRTSDADVERAVAAVAAVLHHQNQSLENS